MNIKSPVETPLMKQYNFFKIKHPDAILLFRVGDFYETFGDDAIRTSKILGIVLTKRANGSASFVELAGFPYHALDTYLPKLIKSGQKVAICEQLEDPKKAKTIVKRGIIELVSPGVTVNDKVLEIKENNYLASIHLMDNKSGISFLDISTGEFYVAEGDTEYIEKLFQNFRPKEIVIQKSKKQDFINLFGEKIMISCFEDWVFTKDFGLDILCKHFRTNSLKGFGVDNFNEGIIAAGAVLHYLNENQQTGLQHITSIKRIEEEKYVWLDRFTLRNLELISSPNDNATTLLDIIDQTQTPMGGRLIRQWLLFPLKQKKAIEERQNIVKYLTDHSEFAENISEEIKQIHDLERLVSKLSVGKCNPRDLQQLARSMQAVERLKQILKNEQTPVLTNFEKHLNPCQDLITHITKTLLEEPSVQINKGNVINKGVNSELDELRNLSFSTKDVLQKIQERESDITGIPSLKISYNNVFGYYLEVTNTHKDKVPDTWIRKQTLTNAERYITEELKEIEVKILGAEEKILSLEIEIFAQLLQSCMKYIEPIQNNAKIIAQLDVLLSFAKIAIENGYTKPEINDSTILKISKGRHPVIEKTLPIGQKYISNDIYLDNETQQIVIITGPNMAGKSALLRQTVLIVLMAQIGCFVPAEAASIGLVDKIFTRVGASDNLSSGESTFMVEMNETATILNNISNRSLIVLDEIGRGTSTYDGVSIAWSIAEYLHEHKKYHAKVLFATHYHELNDMAAQFSRIKNYHVSVKEVGNQVIFLRKLEAGGSAHSFGIHVAEMAGMPNVVVRRAEEILKALENSRNKPTQITLSQKPKENPYQLSFITLDDPLLDDIRDEILDTDINSLTPIEALNKLNDIKRKLTKKK